MLVVLAVVVVHVQRTDAGLHDLELMLDARPDVRVARIENVIHVQMRVTH